MLPFPFMSHTGERKRKTQFSRNIFQRWWEGGRAWPEGPHQGCSVMSNIMSRCYVPHWRGEDARYISALNVTSCVQRYNDIISNDRDGFT